MIAVTILLCTLTALLLVPVSVLLMQVLSARPLANAGLMPAGRRPGLAVIVPAHNEALLIAQTLHSIMPQLVRGDRVLVVADNCSDGTARIALSAGAEVLVRNNDELRGKGYALDAGIRHFAGTPPEVALFIDGDCTVEEGAVERLAKQCLQTSRPVQALYRMQAPAATGLRTRIAEFAWLVKNQVRPLGLHRYGLPCQLMGTGMAFPWLTISRADLASGQIVEDLQLGLELARAGTAPVFCPDARVTSAFPATGQGFSEQRTRWEHGHLGLVIGMAPRALIQALLSGNGPLAVLLLDLCVPPIALLMLLVCAVVALGAAFFAVAGATLPLFLALAALGMAVSAVLIAWWRHGRTIISFGELLATPFYALRKIPLYLRFVSKRQDAWVRTRRDAE